MVSRNTVEVILDFQTRGAQIISRLQREINTLMTALNRVHSGSTSAASSLGTVNTSSDQLRIAIQQLTTQMQSYNTAAHSASSASNDLAGTMGTVGGAIAAAFGGNAVVGSVKQTADDILLLSNRAELLTIEMSELAAMQKVAFQNGNVAEFEEGLKNLSQRIYDLNKNGGGEGLEVLNQLAIDIDELTNMNPSEQFYAIADAMAAAGYSAQDMYGAWDQLGSDQLGDLANLLQDGSSKMRELVEETKNLANALTEVEYQQLALMSEEMAKLDQSIDTSTKKLTAQMSTAIRGVISGYDDLLKKMTESDSILQMGWKAALNTVDFVDRAIETVAGNVSILISSTGSLTNDMAATVVGALAAITGSDALKTLQAELEETSRKLNNVATQSRQNINDAWTRDWASETYDEQIKANEELAKSEIELKKVKNELNKGSSGNNSLEALEADQKASEKAIASAKAAANARFDAEKEAVEKLHQLELQGIEAREKLGQINAEQALALKLKASKDNAEQLLSIERDRLDEEIKLKQQQEVNLQAQLDKTKDKRVKGKEIEAEILAISKEVELLQSRQGELSAKDFEMSELELKKMELKVALEKQRNDLVKERQKISNLSEKTSGAIAANDDFGDDAEQAEKERYELRKAGIERLEKLEKATGREIVDMQIEAAREHADNIAAITEGRINKEIEIERNRLSELQAMREGADNSKERALYDKEIEKSQKNLLTLGQELENIDKNRGALTEAQIQRLETSKIYAKQIKDEEKKITEEKQKQERITKELNDVQQAYLRATGRETEAAINDIDAKYKWLLENLEAGSEELDLVNKMINIDKAETNIQEFERKLNELQSNFKNGEMSYDDFKMGSLDITSQMQDIAAGSGSTELLDKTSQAADKVAKSFDAMRQSGEAAGKSLSTGLASALTDSITGAKSFEDAMVGMLQNIAQQMLEMAMNKMIMQMMSSMFGGMGGAGGFVGGMAAGAMSGSAGQFHEGGAVSGHGGVSRAWNPAWNSIAPRFHTGGAVLKPDEVPAVLQKGEYVMSKNDPRNPLNGSAQQGSQGAQVTVVNTIDDGSIANAMDGPAGHQTIKNVVRSMKNEIKSF
ncbi:hypothetical protein P3547_19930 [Vibrio parahaemolyticus]|nr:hypothetical protein [Vibrio parahaemolyticus]